MRAFIIKAAGALYSVAVAYAVVRGYKSTQSVRVGPPGTGMEVIEMNDRLLVKAEVNAVPPPLPPSSGGNLAIDSYKNVQVLGHISSGDFTRLMTAMTLWVAPNQGCAYCHAPLKDAAGNPVKDEDGQIQADLANMHSDELYTKRVARRMLQMTMRINGDWKTHVKGTGVTCYTCHRGNNVPEYLWFDETPSPTAARMMGDRAHQNAPSKAAGLTSLPGDALRTFLVNDEPIRVVSTEALPIDNRASIKQAEWTYGLMMHMANSLGVSCQYCHNSRQWSDWSQSPPARETAWYGIRMVRELNNAFLEPLHPEYPDNRLGPTGDAPKANCLTCHQGAFKPLLGKSMLADYPVLSEAKPQPAKTVVASTDAPGVDGDGGAMFASDAGIEGGSTTGVTPDGGAGRPDAAGGAPGAADARRR